MKKIDNSKKTDSNRLKFPLRLKLKRFINHPIVRSSIFASLLFASGVSVYYTYQNYKKSKYVRINNWKTTHIKDINSTFDDYFKLFNISKELYSFLVDLNILNSHVKDNDSKRINKDIISHLSQLRLVYDEQLLLENPSNYHIYSLIYEMKNVLSLFINKLSNENIFLLSKQEFLNKSKEFENKLNSTLSEVNFDQYKESSNSINISKTIEDPHSIWWSKLLKDFDVPWIFKQKFNSLTSLNEFIDSTFNLQNLVVLKEKVDKVLPDSLKSQLEELITHKILNLSDITTNLQFYDSLKDFNERLKYINSNLRINDESETKLIKPIRDLLSEWITKLNQELDFIGYDQFRETRSSVY